MDIPCSFVGRDSALRRVKWPSDRAPLIGFRSARCSSNTWDDGGAVEADRVQAQCDAQKLIWEDSTEDILRRRGHHRAAGCLYRFVIAKRIALLAQQ